MFLYIKIFFMKQKRKIKNSFFELILFIISWILSFFRSIKLFFSFKNNRIKKNLFFESFDFIFKIWPKYFWEKPSLYKFFSFPWELIKFILKK